MSIEVGNAHVTLWASTDKLSKQIAGVFKGADNQASAYGQRAGQKMAKAFDSSKPDIEKLNKSVQDSERKLTQVIETNASKQAAAKRAVEIAEQELNEKRASGQTKASALMKAEDKLSAAKQRERAATISATQAQDKAQAELDQTRTALDQASRASQSASTKFATGWRGVGQKIKSYVTSGVKTAGASASASASSAGDTSSARFTSGWRGTGAKLKASVATAMASVKTKANQEGSSIGKESGGRLASAFKGALGGLAAGVGLYNVGGFLSGAITGAGDLEQSVGAISTIFGESSAQMQNWSAEAATSVGLSKNEFNELGTLIGSQLKNGGTAMEELAPKTNNLIALGSDLSSMFGGDTRTAVEALSSALKGERDPIEKYGVSLNQAAIDAKAAELGFEKVGGSLSAEANQAATLALIMDQTADAHGNFARESDTFAHKQQVMAAEWDNLKTKLGEAFLALHNRGCSCGLKPPASSRLRAM